MQTLTIADLKADSLYTVELDGSTLGIGTGDELRDLISEGVLPVNDPLRFRLASA